MHVDLGDVAIAGDVVATADDGNAPCEPVATPCGDGAHDGGDGLCVPPGTCSPGHPVADDGTCSPLPLP